ncbi:hypothetical protein ACFX13_013528 [Malus domestica]
MVASVNKPFPIDGNIIMFSNLDLERVCTQHDDVPFITLQITHTRVSHMLVDGEASVNLVFKDISYDQLSSFNLICKPNRMEGEGKPESKADEDIEYIILDLEMPKLTAKIRAKLSA